MKYLDITAAILLVIGGLNWGLVGMLDMNVVSALLGSGLPAKLIYVAVGLAAVYQAVGLKGIRSRWKVAPVAEAA